MSIIIASQADVFKFALVLYDYLSHNGHAEEANYLSQIVDSCFPDDDLALKAHLKAFTEIKERSKDLPPQYQRTLQSALDFIIQKTESAGIKEAEHNSRECGACDQDAQEIELKLKLQDPQVVEEILQNSWILKLSQNAQPRVKDYETTYYDTLDHHFLKHQVCYRIRNSAGELTATIKGLGSSRGGLSIRSEWNRRLTENAPTLEPFSDLAIGQKMKEIVKGDEILPVFITRFKRTTLDLFCEDGSRIECAIDLGEIEAGDIKEPIREIELELKKGQVESVLKVGEILSDKYSLEPEEKSKYQRGLMLAGLL